jgi:hypothetical protein
MACYKPDFIIILVVKLFSECSKKRMFLDDLEAIVPDRRFPALVLQNHPISAQTSISRTSASKWRSTTNSTLLCCQCYFECNEFKNTFTYNIIACYN